MTTDKAFADRLIAGNGLLPECGDEAPDNPRASMIVEYKNIGGKLAYGVTFEGGDDSKYLGESMYIRNPRVYWQYKAVHS